MKKALSLMLIAGLVLMGFGCAQMSGVGHSSSNLGKIQKKGVLTVGTAANMPPLNMTTKNGDIIGFDIDLARYMASAMGVKLNVVTRKFSELLPALEKKEVDMVISGMTITPERNLTVEFAGPYHVSGKSFLTKKSTIASTKKPSNLNSPSYAFTALKGSTSEILIKKLMPQAMYFPVDNYDDGVAMVLSNRADAMVSDYHACLVALLRHPKDNLVTVITPFTYEPLGIALPPGDVHFLNWVNNFLNTMEGSDELDALKLRWIKNPSWLRLLP